MSDKNDSIVFGGGCFWCAEAVYAMFRGVVKTTPGYAGGTTKNPTYEQVCKGDTGHAEVLEITYDPSIMALKTLLEIFFAMHDPTSLNRQGSDHGSQYRSIVLYNSEAQKKTVESFIKNLQREYKRPIVTEVKKLGAFYAAEEYHQRYYEKNPMHPYCMLIISPKIKKIREKFGLKK